MSRVLNYKMEDELKQLHQRAIAIAYKYLQAKGTHNMLDYHGIRRTAYDDGLYEFIVYTEDPQNYNNLQTNYKTEVEGVLTDDDRRELETDLQTIHDHAIFLQNTYRSALSQ